MGRTLLSGALAWLGLSLLYLGLVGSVSATEALAAAICGALGTISLRWLALCGQDALKVRPDALRPLVGSLARLPKESLRVGLRLARGVWRGGPIGTVRAATEGEIIGCPLRGDSAEEAGRRAVSVLATSITPDAFVLRLEAERGRILVHVLPPGAAAR